MLAGHMTNPKPRPEARRLLAADLFAKNKSYTEVATIFGVSEEAARKWKLRWDEGGKAAMKEKREGRRGPKFALSDKEAQRLMVRAKRDGASTLAELHRLAESMSLGGGVSRSGLRRKLVALGHWPAGKGD